MAYEFEETITDEALLREIVGEPFQGAAEKPLDHIDDIFSRFIAASPFVVMGTANELGYVDLSPKGDPAGFIKVLDEKTLVFPDRPGNKRADSLTNLLQNPSIGLIFIIPKMRETLRVAGRGRIVRDSKLQAELAVNGKTPDLLVAIDVQIAYMHCAKCMIRSHLWEPEEWASTDDVPRMVDAAKKKYDFNQEQVKKVENALADDERERLY